MRLIDADALREKLIALNYHTRAENMNEACVRTVDYAPTMGGWVSAKDRLPEKNVPVLVWEKQGFAYVDRLEAECAWQIASTHHAIVTHWMPLPEPPEEVKRE